MGASRLEVRWTVRMRLFERGSLFEEMAIWVWFWGEEGRVLLISVPPDVGEPGRFDIFFGEGRELS